MVPFCIYISERLKTETKGEIKMKKCPNCGNKANANFCTNCGSEMIEMPRKVGKVGPIFRITLAALLTVAITVLFI